MCKYSNGSQYSFMQFDSWQVQLFEFFKYSNLLNNFTTPIIPNLDSSQTQIICWLRGIAKMIS